MICMKKAMLALALALAMVACATVVVDSSDADTTSEGFEYTTNQSVVSITGYTGDDKVVFIPEKINNNPVEAINDRVFENKGIEEVIIPSSVKSIGDNAFLSCTSLKYVTIGGTVDIGKSAFVGCTSLKFIDFKAQPGAIGENAFDLKSEQKCSYRVSTGGSVTELEGNEYFEKIGSDKKIVRFETSGQVPDDVGDLGFLIKDTEETIEIPKNAEKHGYDIKVFNGEEELDLTTFKVGDSDLKLTLEYTYSLFTVEFRVDGVTYQKSNLSFNSDITLPKDNPTKEMDAQYIYTFKEWEGYTAGMKVKDNVVFNAVFDEKLREYTIKFVADGKEIFNKVMKYGETIVPPEDPVKASEDGIDYRFTGWNGPAGWTVTGDAVYTAVFVESDHEYTIKFVVDGKTVKEEKLLYQEEITAPEDPVKEDADGIRYTFTGWEGYTPGMTVTDDATFNAVFSESPVDDGSGSTWIIIVVVVIVVILLALVFLRKFL